MNLNRLLNTPYLNLSEFPTKQWEISGEMWVSRPDQETLLLTAILDSITPSEATLNPFQHENLIINSEESFQTLIDSLIKELELVLFYDIFKIRKREASMKAFLEMSIPERSELLGLSNYPKDRNLKTLMDELNKSKRIKRL